MEEKGTAETTATETVKHLPTKDEHAFGTHLKEEHSREHRGKTTSTIILTVVFISTDQTVSTFFSQNQQAVPYSPFPSFPGKITRSSIRSNRQRRSHRSHRRNRVIVPHHQRHPLSLHQGRVRVRMGQRLGSCSRRYTHRIITSHRRRRHPQTLLHGHRLCHTAIVSVFPYLMSLVALTPTNLLE